MEQLNKILQNENFSFYIVLAIIALIALFLIKAIKTLKNRLEANNEALQASQKMYKELDELKTEVKNKELAEYDDELTIIKRKVSETEAYFKELKTDLAEWMGIPKSKTINQKQSCGQCEERQKEANKEIKKLLNETNLPIKELDYCPVCIAIFTGGILLCDGCGYKKAECICSDTREREKSPDKPKKPKKPNSHTSLFGSP